MLEIKASLRNLRLEAGFSMNRGAELLRVSRKQLEDIETVRNYGCHVDAEVMGRATMIYDTDMSMFAPSHMKNKGSYFERPKGKAKR
tara:strand:+ start:245 stop:505 length:261 start_codon:yes stop_codon:yes gene_type:complete